MADLKSQIANLTAVLDSGNESEAKNAATSLDGLLYHHYESPCVVTVEYDTRMRELHAATLRGSEVLDPLLNVARHGTTFARVYALKVLAIIGERRAFSLAIDALTDSQPPIRVAATSALWFFRDAEAVNALIKTLHDPDAESRHGAASALGFIGSSEAVPALMAYYERGNAECKSAAIHALGDICDPPSLPLVRDALINKPRQIRQAAKYALSRYDQKRRDAGSASG